ncbi:hypothetical protein [Yoonia vestfoldensis]|uniref:Uncharacterized protein n=1 Tax=Yoonia vestfoldensis TaxID=245188 RepID=A0A1Y0EIF7_9RHOB|nr:hypothetical protein LOKVESSMR4R_03978 [Yoonia vestfoldensis]
MNIAEIKTAVDGGKTVHWSNEGYVVRKDILGQYLIVFEPNGSAIGLADRSGGRLNGQEEEFFLSDRSV